MNSSAIPKIRYTYREYQYFPDNGFRHEIIDGDHYMSPAPSTKHQRVSSHLQFQLYTQIKLTKRGVVFDAPTDVELAPHDIVQPDLLVVMNAHKQIIGQKRIIGVPDLIIEILSESNPEHDRSLKFEMYRKNNVPEYWIVDPHGETVQQWVLDSLSNYLLLGSHHESISVSTISEVKVNLLAVWED